MVLRAFARLGVVEVTEDDSGTLISCTNLTLLNCMLVVRGPMPEGRLTVEYIIVQILGSSFAFFVRYGLAGLFYSEEDNRR